MYSILRMSCGLNKNLYTRLNFSLQSYPYVIAQICAHNLFSSLHNFPCSRFIKKELIFHLVTTMEQMSTKVSHKIYTAILVNLTDCFHVTSFHKAWWDNFTGP